MSEFEKYWEENASKESWANKAVAWNIWKEKQAIINALKAQLENMEQCYIEKKKQVDAVEHVLCELKESMIDFQEMDLYDKGHRVTTEYVISDLEEALRGVNNSFTKARQKAEDQINNGVRLTKHQIDL